MKFSELGVTETLQRVLESQGIDVPTEIQRESIPLLINNESDFIGQAQTGTGKTLAFLLPLLHKVDGSLGYIQAIILAPTRELASQIKAETDKLTENSDLNSVCVYGGQPISGQVREIKKLRAQIVIATPGRCKDLIERKLIDLSQCSLAVLDEADEMLDMGFLADVKDILKSLTESNKTWMFSATMPSEILNLIKDFFIDPLTVKVQRKTLSNENVSQSYYLVKTENKLECLSRLLDSLNHYYAIVFCRTKIETKELSDELNKLGFKADALHGDMAQDQRDLTMNRFKRKEIQLLVCTDVAARGIDVDNITHVFNFGLPQDNEAYVHRIGRTGRAGRKGMAISLIDPLDARRLNEIESITKAKIERSWLPELDQLKKAMLLKEIDQIESLNKQEILDSENFQNFEEAISDYSIEELRKILFKTGLEKKCLYYQNAQKIDLMDRKARPVRAGFKKIYINLGRQDGYETGDLLRLICRSANLPGKEIGKIILKDYFAFFELTERSVDQVLRELKDKSIDGKTIQCDVSSDKDKRPRRKKSFSNTQRY